MKMNVLNKYEVAVSKVLMSRPLAVFSIISFIFIILRLHFSVQPLLAVTLFAGLILICLNYKNLITKFILFFILSAFFVGIFSASNFVQKNEVLVNMLDGQHVRLYGSVSSVPKNGKYSTSFYIDTDTVYYNKGVYKRPLKVRVVADDGIQCDFGDKITLNALLTANKSISDYDKSFLAKGAIFTAHDVVVLNTAENKADFVATIRNYIFNISERIKLKEVRMLFKALVAGDKSDFSSELTDNLSKSGLSHIAAVSGLHVSILGLGIYNLLRRKNGKIALVVSLVAVFLFALITGASPSTMRATIMFVSFLLSKLTIYENDSFTSLSFSALVLAVLNPYVIYDWGFILSYLSVLGIQLFSYDFKNMLRFLPEFLSDSISVTLAAQIMTIPPLTVMFGYLPVYSILANIAVSSVFLYALYFCVAFVLLAKVPVINQIMMSLCSLFVYVVASVANVFASLPFATVRASAFSLHEIVCYYFVAFLMLCRNKLSNEALFVGLCLALFAVLLL